MSWPSSDSGTSLVKYPALAAFADKISPDWLGLISGCSNPKYSDKPKRLGAYKLPFSTVGPNSPAKDKALDSPLIPAFLIPAASDFGASSSRKNPSGAASSDSSRKNSAILFNLFYSPFAVRVPFTRKCITRWRCRRLFAIKANIF